MVSEKPSFRSKMSQFWDEEDGSVVVFYIGLFNEITAIILYITFRVFKEECVQYVLNIFLVPENAVGETLKVLGLCMIIQIIFSLLLIYGAIKESSVLTLFWLFVDGMLVFCYIIIITIGGVLYFRTKPHRALPGVLLLIVSVCVGLECWYISVVAKQCISWEEERKNKKRYIRRNRHDPVVQEIILEEEI